MRKEIVGSDDIYEVPLPADFKGQAVDAEDDDEDGVQSLIARAVEQGIQWRQENLDQMQELATDYYMGAPFGDEEEGRSQVVMTVVRDVVKAIMPSLLRIFFGPERVVEFKPRGPEDVAIARQQTEYVNYIVTEDNPGFLVIYSTLKDALLRKKGVVKYWWENIPRVSGESYTDINAEQIMVLAKDDGVEIDLKPSKMSKPPAQQDPSQPPAEPEQLYNATVKRTNTEGRIRLVAIPPEEFIYSPNARSMEDAHMVAHVRTMPADELIAMGIDEDIVEKHKGKVRSILGGEKLESARRVDFGASNTSEDVQDESTRDVEYAEVWMRINSDGDDVAEMRKFQCVGIECEIVNGEGDIEDRPFAVFGPDPEPHTMDGLCPADSCMDLQRIESAVMRGMLDSLSECLDPSTEVVEGEVNMGDLLNKEKSRVIRVRKPGMIREITQTFVGAAGLSVMQYLAEVRENRTGMSKAAAGLDADALQSSTKAAVAATITASQQQIEMIARILAETGMKDLFKGILKLVVRHQDAARMVRLNGKFVQVDPRSWDATMDVVTNVALGQGTIEERMQLLGLLGSKQGELKAAGAPFVSWARVRATAARITELAGFNNSNEFWDPWTDEDDKRMQEAQKNAPPPPDAATMLAQVEMQKAQFQKEKNEQEIAIKRETMYLENDREKDRMAREFALKNYELELKYHMQHNDSLLSSAVEQDRAAQDADIERDKVQKEHEREQQAAQMQHERESQALAQQAQQPEGGAA